MKAWLSALTAKTWQDLRALPAERWLWVDATPPGVHYDPQLPETAPQTTQVWGWTSAWALRARTDIDLPGPDVGVLGAVLTWSEPVPADAVEVECTEAIRPVWARDHGRSSIAEVPGLTGKDGSVDLVTLDVLREVRNDQGVTLVPLTFLRD